jgi:hypothetical protein
MEERMIEERMISVVIPFKYYSRAFAEYMRDVLGFEPKARYGPQDPFGWAMVTTSITSGGIKTILLNQWGIELVQSATITESFKDPKAGSEIDLQNVLKESKTDLIGEYATLVGIGNPICGKTRPVHNPIYGKIRLVHLDEAGFAAVLEIVTPEEHKGELVTCRLSHLKV